MKCSIVIGQACEFDYSGSQAVKALKEEGYEVILVNSNPATIMTDPNMADRTYAEPLEHDTLAAIVRKERPCAILPTMSGQKALNAALGLAKLNKNHNCMIVCSIENMDPMGVHTGDSITVAPVQTLTDREYQIMRDASIAIMREIGAETGGSNVQFAQNPANGESEHNKASLKLAKAAAHIFSLWHAENLEPYAPKSCY